MSQLFKILDLDTVKTAPLHKEPFPYLIINNIFRNECTSDVVNSFPAINSRGSFPLSATTYSGCFATLIEELQHPALKKLIGERFNMNLEDKPTMITLRGQTTKRDGHIHVDSSSKLITVLLYLNSNWQSPKGRLRLLYNNHDLNNYAAEISPEAGSCLIFKVTPNCWHGHEVFEGERRSIQLNYVSSEKASAAHLQRHRFSAFIKKLFSRKHETHSIY